MQNHDPLSQQDKRLDQLWLAYRDACPDPESGADFMPRLWQKIEAKRSESLSVFKRLAQVCVAATAVLLALLSAMPTPSVDPDGLDPGPYTEILAADQTKEAYSIIHPAIFVPDSQGDQN